MTGSPMSDWAAGGRVAEVAPDGRSVVFQSRRSLTGYEMPTLNNRPTEAFVYSAGDGRLACASCSPTGAPPVLGDGEVEEA